MEQQKGGRHAVNKFRRPVSMNMSIDDKEVMLHQNTPGGRLSVKGRKFMKRSFDSTLTNSAVGVEPHTNGIHTPYGGKQGTCI